MPLSMQTIGTKVGRARLARALSTASHVFSVVPLADDVVEGTPAVVCVSQTQLPDPTDRLPWGPEELRAFKCLAVQALTVADPRSDRTMVFVCKAGKNRSATLLWSIAYALHLEPAWPKPVDPQMDKFARLVFSHEFESLTRWPPAKSKRAREP